MPNPLVYASAAFTTSGGVVDDEQLRQEFVGSSFPSTPVTFLSIDRVGVGGTLSVSVFFSGVPNATDEATADALVAAHDATGPTDPEPGPEPTDEDAIHDNIAGEIVAITEKVTPVDADIVVIEDSADSDNKKKVQLGNITPAAHTHTHASTTGQTVDDHHNQVHDIDGADHTGQLGTAKIADGAVTLPKLEDRAASTLIGRGEGGGAGDPQELTLGGSLRMEATVLHSDGVVAATQNWKFSNSTVDANPGAGFFRINAGGDTLFISDISDSGVPVGSELLKLRIGDEATILQESDFNRFRVFEVRASTIDATAYVKIPVTALQTGSTFQNNQLCGFRFERFASPSAFPELYRAGLLVKSNSVTVVEAGAGNVRDSTDIFDIAVTSPITAAITASGAGGLDTGSEAASTWYAVHVIADTTVTNATTLLLSLSTTAPTLPAGYDVFRHIGWARNDASSDIIPFRYYTTTFCQYLTDRTVQVVLSGGSSTTFATVDCSAFIPPTSNLSNFSFSWAPVATTSSAQLRPEGIAATNQITLRVAETSTSSYRLLPYLMTLSDAQEIEYIVSSGSDSLFIYIHGFLDSIF